MTAMKDYIEKQNIENRRVILEVRYKAKPSIIGKLGDIAEKMENEKIFSPLSWSLEYPALIIKDNRDQRKANQLYVVEYNRIRYSSYRVDTNEALYDKFKKLFELTNSIIHEPIYTIYKCFITGTYKSKTENFGALIKVWDSIIPPQLKLNSLTMNDMRFQMTYDCGTYEIGPLNSEDNFFTNYFRDRVDVNHHVGFAIHTENQIIAGTEGNDTLKKIKNLFDESLQIEKELYDKLREM